MLKKNRFLFYTIVLCMVLASAGCAKKAKNIGTPQTVNPPGVTTTQVTTPSGTTTTPPGTTTTPGGTAVMVKPPTGLTTLYNNALKVIGEIEAKKWKSAEKRAGSMRTEFAKLTTKLVSAGVPSTTISNIASSLNNLPANIAAKKVYEAKVDANDVTRYIADALGSYKVVIPTDFSKLDYYLRDIQYSAVNKDWNRANDDLGFIKSIWSSSSGLMSPKSKNIKKVNTDITSLQKAIVKKNTKTTLREARKILTTIASVKKDFAKSRR